MTTESCLGWNRQGLINRPATFESLEHCRNFKTVFRSQLTYTFCFTIKLIATISTCIVRLLRGRSPMPIVRPVWAIIVISVQRAPFWSLTYIGNKIRKIMPPFHYINAAAAISQIGDMVGTVASLHHAHPSTIQFVLGKSVLRGCFAGSFSVKTAAALRTARLQTPNTDDGFIATVATAAPQARPNSFKYNQSAISIADNISQARTFTRTRSEQCATNGGFGFAVKTPTKPYGIPFAVISSIRKRSPATKILIANVFKTIAHLNLRTGSFYHNATPAITAKGGRIPCNQL